jgi:hypothetical protein
MLLERKEMQVINSEDLNYYPKNSFQDYPIRVALYAPNGNSIPFDGSVFNIIVMQTYSNYSNTQLLNTKRTTMSMVNCTEKHTKNYLTLVPERAPYEKCVDAKNLEVVGYDGFKLKPYSYLAFVLIACTNSTSGGKCRSQQEINSSLDGATMSITTMKGTVDNSNRINPIGLIPLDVSILVSTTLTRKRRVFLAYNYYMDDRGFIFESFTSYNTTTVETFRDEYTMPLYSPTYKTNFVALVNLENHNSLKITTRTFQKAQATLANVGGLIKSLTVIGSIINMIFTRKCIYLTLGNSIFNYNASTTSHDNRRLTNLNLHKNISKINNNNKHVTEDNKITKPSSQEILKNTGFHKAVTNDSNKFKEIEEDKLKLKNGSHEKEKKLNIFDVEASSRQQMLSTKKLNFTLWEFCCFDKCIRDKKKNYKYNMTKNLINRKASIETIILDSYKIQKLVKIVLTENQQKVFNDMKCIGIDFEK